MEIANGSLEEAKPFYDKIKIFDNQSIFQYAEKKLALLKLSKK